MAVSPFAIGEKIDIGSGKKYCMLKNGSPDEYGLVFLPKYTVTQVHWENGAINGRVIIGDFHTKALKCVCTVKDNVIESLEDLSKVEWRIIDLSDDGSRWEGDTLNEVPFGWGVYYDENNCKLFEGFRLNETTVCYGVYYHPLMNTDTVYYQGLLCEGKRWGVGEMHDRTGRLVYQGDWIDDGSNFKTVTIPSAAEDLHGLHSLMEQLVIGDDCCTQLSSFTIEHHTRLQSLTIGERCFSAKHPEQECCFRLVDLPMLKSVHVGDRSFEYFNVFVMHGVSERANPP